MTTKFINGGEVIVEYHNNFVNDGEKFNTFTIAQNEQGGWEFNLTQENAVILARFLKVYLEVKL